MRQLQVTVPEEFSDEGKEVIEGFSSDVNSSNIDRDDYRAVEVSATVDSEDIDELTEDLKGIEGIDSGKLTIRVLDQESLIEKGQKTKGSFSALS